MKSRGYHGKALKYVTEITDSGDVVIGKDGDIVVKDGSLSVSCGGKLLFKCGEDEVTCGDLMSLDGVVITGLDFVSGTNRSIIAYFKYYRK